jgi:hypothetical protein
VAYNLVIAEDHERREHGGSLGGSGVRSLADLSLSYGDTQHRSHGRGRGGVSAEIGIEEYLSDAEEDR